MKIHAKPDIKTHTFQGMITSSPKMTNFFEVLRRVATTDSAVLIRGETGTGKELVARTIHNLSSRSTYNFNAVNCAMLMPDLFNSELFGHVKGSFTGAITDHKGFFEESHLGTLFLDEVAELPINAQSRLLRVLQEKNFMKVGSTKPISVNVRILSATHKSLRYEVKEGLFREDLMYRLRVVPIFLPRLVERGKDIEILTWRFIEEFNRQNHRFISALSHDAREAILSYEWPGNIRELRNNIEYAFAIGEGTTLTLDELTPELQGKDIFKPEVAASTLDYEKKERQKIISALNNAMGNKGEAAQALGISRSTLWRKIKTLHIN